MSVEYRVLKTPIKMGGVSYPLTAVIKKNEKWVSVSILFPDDYPRTPFYDWVCKNGNSCMAELEVLHENHTIWIVKSWLEMLDHPTISQQEYNISMSLHSIIWSLIVKTLRLDDLYEYYMVRVETMDEVDNKWYRKHYKMNEIQTMKKIIMESKLTDVLARVI